MENKNRNVTLLLCALGLLGFGGLHYFYLGKYIKGILYFITAGVFYIGTIIDLLKILSGNFDAGDSSPSVQGNHPGQKLHPVDRIILPFGGWNENEHRIEGQRPRRFRAIYYEILDGTLDQQNKTCKIQGSEEEPYCVSLSSCTCMDFQKRHLPCKHIYRLAIELGFVEVKPIQLEPLSLPDFHCDSGGYMNKSLFRVTATATNPKTKRKNKVPFKVESLENIEKTLESMGYVPPYETVDVQSGYQQPTDRQYWFANELGLHIPHGSTRDDVSAMIDRVVTGNQTPPSAQQINSLVNRNIVFSRMSNAKTIAESKELS